MEQVKRLGSALFAGVVGFAFACSGSINDVGNGPSAGNAGTDSGLGGGSGSGATTGASGSLGTGTGISTGTATTTGTGTGTGAGTGTGTGGSGGAGAGQGGAAVSTGGAPVVTTPPANPGFVVARRLNRAEYNNTVRDLLGTTQVPANDFPADDLGGDFDTVGSALTLSPAYVLAYEKAAQALTTELFAADAARKAKVLTCNVDTGGDTCARQILTAFTRRAFRRPATTEELDALMGPIAKAKELALTPSEGMRSALTAVLLSPAFVFKLEIDPDPNSKAVRRLTPAELATRLSYALWATMPDDTLNQLVDRGELTTDEQVAAQVDRMLADPRSDALLDGFSGRWLSYSGLDTHEVEASKVPKYTPQLLRSMKTEATRFVKDFLQSTRPVSEMLNARFTYVDSTLATFYGVSATGASATNFVRVDTSNVPRAGLLTLGAMLTTTSYASRTSPVRRGDFVFSHLLCQTIPPPPPDIPGLPETTTTALTMRQRLEQHRADPACSGCHNLMDPIGFGLETYDAIGGYRTMEGTTPIDAKGVLPDGRSFNGAIELGGLLASDPRFPACVTQKFMTFAIGRLLNQPDDRAWTSYLSYRAESGGGTLASVIKAVLTSDAFRSRQQQALQ